MASLIQISEAIETGKIRFSGDVQNGVNAGDLPDFNHKNPADWLHKRAGNNTEYISLLRKCE